MRVCVSLRMILSLYICVYDYAYTCYALFSIIFVCFCVCMRGRYSVYTWVYAHPGIIESISLCMFFYACINVCTFLSVRAVFIACLFVHVFTCKWVRTLLYACLSVYISACLVLHVYRSILLRMRAFLYVCCFMRLNVYRCSCVCV